MKQILTLLVSVTLVTAAFAQTDAERRDAKRIILGDKKGATSYPKNSDERDVIHGDDRTVYGGTERRYPERYPATSGASRERRVYEINRTYDAKINAVRRNTALSKSQKERIISRLEAQRRQKIRDINGEYNGSGKRYGQNDDAYKKGKKYKKNNGNHYGWQKGKGNPHRGK